MKLVHWERGSLFIPWRTGPTGEPVFRPRRILIDWADEYAPRRLYYHGWRFGVDVALCRDGLVQRYDWQGHRFSNRWSWVSVYPTDYRERAKREAG